MFGQTFYYSALDVGEVRALLEDAALTIERCEVDYREATTGERDLLVVARKAAAEKPLGGGLRAEALQIQSFAARLRNSLAAKDRRQDVVDGPAPDARQGSSCCRFGAICSS